MTTTTAGTQRDMRDSQLIIRLATIILATGEAKGWSAALEAARKQVRG